MINVFKSYVMRKFLYLLLIFLLIFTLPACSNLKYSDAVYAYDTEDYETAISLFEELGDYEDSKEKLLDSLDKYVETLITDREWDKATTYLTKYQNLVNDEEYKRIYTEAIEDYIKHLIINDEEWEKATKMIDTYNETYDIAYLYDYVLYFHGLHLLDESVNNDYTEGFDMLSNVTDQSDLYESAQTMINNYYKLKDSPIVQQYLGSWKMKTTAMGLIFEGSLYFELEYSKVVCYESADQDGYVISSNHDLSYEDFNNDGISSNNFSCWLNDDGTLSYGGYRYKKQ